MSQAVKKDLFAPIVVKKRQRGGERTHKWAIPENRKWKDKHGSWAVMKGIVKIEPQTGG